MSTLMVSGSGIRGILGDSLTPAVILKYTSAYGHMQRTSQDMDPVHTASNTVVIGRDSRGSGPWVEDLVCGTLMSQGFDVILLGIVPTPTVQLIVIQKQAMGGIVITSSHNPVEWNGLKLIDYDGLFLSPLKCGKLFEIADSPKVVKYVEWNRYGSKQQYNNSITDHLDSIFKLPFYNVEKIRQRKFKICLDTINGAGVHIMKLLLEHLGAEVIAINDIEDGLFSHSPEPIPENLYNLCALVKENQADLGIAVDPDADRCVLIDGEGEPLGEEYTLAIVVDFILNYHKKGNVVKNLSSSRVIDDIAKNYGCSVFSTPVGELHVAKKMLEKKAVIGGEGNGGVMLPDVHIGRDAPVAAAIILLALAQFEGNLKQLKSSLPQWSIVKLKVSVADVNVVDALRQIQQEWESKGAQINLEDGIRIDCDEFWVHLRKSNTEPIVRVIGEGRTPQKAEEICIAFMNQIKSFKNNE